MLFDERYDFLARGRGDGADDVAAALIADQVACAFDIGSEIGMRIEEGQLDPGAAGGAIIVIGKIGAIAA